MDNGQWIMDNYFGNVPNFLVIARSAATRQSVISKGDERERIPTTSVRTGLGMTGVGKFLGK